MPMQWTISQATRLVMAVAEAAEEPNDFHFLYPSEASLREKIETVATRVYGADGVEYSPQAGRQLEQVLFAAAQVLPRPVRV